jgi:heme exporter protein A
MLEVIGLKCVRGKRELFEDLSFALQPGDFLQLTGANGSGKTSLLRMLAGLLRPLRGDILWQGESIEALGESYFSMVTYLGHRTAVKDELTALENFRSSCGWSGVEVNRGDAVTALGRMGLRGREHVPARFLSEGQRRRLALARLAVCGTTLWLLDEVLASLDSGAAAAVRWLIEEHLDEGGMAVVATHQELDLCARSFQRIDLASPELPHWPPGPGCSAGWSGGT